MPVLIATITPWPGKADEVRAALLAAVVEVHPEQGCELYALHEAPDRFVMIEHWTNAELLERHMGAASVSRLDALLEGNVTRSPELLFVEPLPAGDRTKGCLASVAAKLVQPGDHRRHIRT